MGLGVVGGILVGIGAASIGAGDSGASVARRDPHGDVVADDDREVVEVHSIPRVEGELGERLPAPAALEVHSVGAVAAVAACT